MLKVKVNYMKCWFVACIDRPLLRDTGNYRKSYPSQNPQGYHRIFFITYYV